MSTISRVIKWLWQSTKQCLRNCGIHGVKYLVHENYTYMERFIWLIFCGLSWYGCYFIIIDTLDVYFYTPVEVTAETSFLNWRTPFPSIAICLETSNQIQSMGFYTPPSFEMPTDVSKDLTAEDLSSFYKNIEVPCSSLLSTCKWNDMEFDCCKDFKLLPKTGIGHCHIANSYHIHHSSKKSVKYFINRTVEYGDFIINVNLTHETKEFSSYLFVYLLNNLQLPCITTQKESIISVPQKNTRLNFVMWDTYNEEGLEKYSIKQRDCRFPHEHISDSIFSIYSSDSCIIELYVRQMIKYCGCVHFYYPVPNNARLCNASELQCLIDYKDDIKSKPLIRKMCISDCAGTTLYIHQVNLTKSDENPKDYYAPSRIHIKLLSHPTMRHYRYAVTSLANVIVSVGGALGLFIGANILTFFEIPYWFFFRRS